MDGKCRFGSGWLRLVCERRGWCTHHTKLAIRLGWGRRNLPRAEAVGWLASGTGPSRGVGGAARGGARGNRLGGSRSACWFYGMGHFGGLCRSTRLPMRGFPSTFTRGGARVLAVSRGDGDFDPISTREPG